MHFNHWVDEEPTIGKVTLNFVTCAEKLCEKFSFFELYCGKFEGVSFDNEELMQFLQYKRYAMVKPCGSLLNTLSHKCVGVLNWYISCSIKSLDQRYNKRTAAHQHSNINTSFDFSLLND